MNVRCARSPSYPSCARWRARRGTPRPRMTPDGRTPQSLSTLPRSRQTLVGTLEMSTRAAALTPVLMPAQPTRRWTRLKHAARCRAATAWPDCRRAPWAARRGDAARRPARQASVLTSHSAPRPGAPRRACARVPSTSSAATRSPPLTRAQRRLRAAAWREAAAAVTLTCPPAASTIRSTGAVRPPARRACACPRRRAAGRGCTPQVSARAPWTSSAARPPRRWARRAPPRITRNPTLASPRLLSTCAVPPA